MYCMYALPLRITASADAAAATRSEADSSPLPHRRSKPRDARPPPHAGMYVPHFSLYYFFDFHAVNVHEFTGWCVARSPRGAIPRSRPLCGLTVKATPASPSAVRNRTFTCIGCCHLLAHPSAATFDRDSHQVGLPLASPTITPHRPFPTAGW